MKTVSFLHKIKPSDSPLRTGSTNYDSKTTDGFHLNLITSPSHFHLHNRNDSSSDSENEDNYEDNVYEGKVSPIVDQLSFLKPKEKEPKPSWIEVYKKLFLDNNNNKIKLSEIELRFKIKPFKKQSEVKQNLTNEKNNFINSLVLHLNNFDEDHKTDLNNFTYKDKGFLKCLINATERVNLIKEKPEVKELKFNRELNRRTSLIIPTNQQPKLFPERRCATIKEKDETEYLKDFKKLFLLPGTMPLNGVEHDTGNKNESPKKNFELNLGHTHSSSKVSLVNKKNLDRQNSVQSHTSPPTKRTVSFGHSQEIKIKPTEGMRIYSHHGPLIKGKPKSYNIMLNLVAALDNLSHIKKLLTKGIDYFI